MNENIQPVCISKEGGDNLGADEGFSREPEKVPVPGNPTQLIKKLRNQGWPLAGYNNDVEQDPLLVPVSWSVCKIICGITEALETAHSIKVVDVTYIVQGYNLSEYDVNRISGTFSLRGFTIWYDKDSNEFHAKWASDAWEGFLPAPSFVPTLFPTAPASPDSTPVQLEIPGTEGDNDATISNVASLTSLLVKEGVKISLSDRMKPAGFWVRASWGEPGELALFRALLKGVYDSAIAGGNSYSTEFILDIRPGELVEYLREVGFRVELSTVKGGDVFMQKITMSWGFL